MEVLKPEEAILEGQWIVVGTGVRGDATEMRITSLIDEQLMLLRSSSDGWSRLYKDPRDGRLWELTYPRSEMHGGGPKKLAVISFYTAQEQYGSFT